MTARVKKRTSSRTQGTSRRLSGLINTDVLFGILGLIAFLGTWQLASSTGWLSPQAVPAPLKVWTALNALVATPAFWGAVAETTLTALIGLVFVIAIAIPLALAIHQYFFFRESTWFVIEFFKPIPPVALLPMTILLWGPTKTVELFLVVFAALWPMLTQLVYGLREVSGTALDVARVYRFSSSQRLNKIIIPSLMPFAMTGFRISLSMALVTAIVTEYIVGIPGLGAMLSTAQANGLLDKMYALIVAMGAIGLLLNAALALLNKPILFWHASQRERIAA